MYINGSGMVNFNPWKGLILLFIILLSSLSLLRAQTYDVTITVTPDCWGQETSWQLLTDDDDDGVDNDDDDDNDNDDDGDDGDNDDDDDNDNDDDGDDGDNDDNDGNSVIAFISIGDYDYGAPNGPGTYNHTVTLTAGNCYTFKISDSNGDGMAGSGSSGCGVDGTFVITYGTDTLVQLIDPAFGSSEEFEFCITEGCTDTAASNYDSAATVNNDSCEYITPSANFSWSESSSGCSKATVSFTNSSSDASSYLWTFENGTPGTSTEASPTVIFPTGASYQVTLTAVSGDLENVETDTVTVAANEDGNEVTFVLQPDCWGSEISWKIKDSSGDVLYSLDENDLQDYFPEYPNEERTWMCLTDGEYTLEIEDDGEDGLSGEQYWACDQDGTFWFEDVAGNVFQSFNGDPDFGEEHDEDLTINLTYVWTGNFDSDWNNSGNWQEGVVPQSQHNVRIAQTNFAPNLDASITMERLVIDSSSTFNFANGSGKIKLEGDLIINGTLDASAGMILMQGDQHQYIKGNAPTFYQLKINSTDTVSLLTDMNLRSALIPTKGVFDFNNQDVTLLSDANNTGSIGEITSNADILGDTITIQRYFPAGPGSWRMLCTPIIDATFEQWNDDIPTTGFPGSDYPNYPSSSNPWSNIRFYNETYSTGDDADLDVGFESISNVTDTIGNTRGYFVYIVPSPTTIDVRGSFHKNNQNWDLQFTESNSDPFNDGWNLVANPFPSAINWDNASGWIKTDLNNAIYAYDPVNSQYSSYVNGISVGSMDGTIASSQAFWVKSETGSPTVEITESAKINTSGVHMRSEDLNTKTIIRIKLITEGEWDETVVGFHTQATEGFDGQYDAYKFFSSDETLPNLASVGDTSANNLTNIMGINMYPIPEEEIPIDLIVRKGSHSEFMLSNEMMDSFDDNICLVLEDKELGVSVPFDQGDWYNFTMGDESLENRFSLHVSAPLKHDEFPESCPDMNDGSAVAHGFGAAPWNFIWKDADGTVIKETLESYSEDEITGLTPGYYELVVESSSELCPSAVNVVTIMPAPDEWGAAEVTTLTCNNDSEASIEISGEMNYNWEVMVYDDNNNVVHTIDALSGDSTLTNLSAGDFYVEMISSCGNQVSVNNLDTRSPHSIDAEFFTNSEAINLYNGGTADFINNSNNALNFVWDFGNGQVDSTNIDGQCIYTEIGLYEVTLIASNEYCSDQFTNIVAVVWGENTDDNSQPTFSQASDVDTQRGDARGTKPKDDKIQVSYDKNIIVVLSELVIEEQVIFKIFNGVGQLVHQETRDQLDLSPVELNINQLPQGVFYLNIMSGEQLLKTDKFLKN